MSAGHHHHHAVSADPGFSLLRLSAATRMGGAGIIAALLWLAILAVIA